MATKKISEMITATDLTGAVIPIVQGGVNKKADITLINQEATTASNGITKTVNDIQLGGSLTKDTTISGDFDLTININGAINLNAPIQSLNISTPEVLLSTNNIAVEDTTTISGSSPSFLGLRYNDDYSLNFETFSLVDKGYVDAAVSDIRLKENIQPIESALNQVMQLKPCTFDMKTDGEHKAGFIAQELQEVFPEMIKEDEYLKIKRDQLIPYLVKCIQELKAEIEILKAK